MTLQYVDLAEMSMSGTLRPSIPVQILLKYAPPKLTIVYHFENQDHEQYFHDIPLDRNMLQNETDEDIVSHLYMAEAYYFNPKILKRAQVSPPDETDIFKVKRLVKKLKTHFNDYGYDDKSPERHSIHSTNSRQGSGSPPMGNRFDRAQANQNQAFLGNIDGLALPNRRSPPRSNNNQAQ